MQLKQLRISFLAMPLVCMLLVSAVALAAPPGKTLLVVAHPDDEYYFAATVYRMVVQLGGRVDELIITDGEGGFRYSTLAEPYYKTSLTTEAVGRRELPAIRKEEALNAGRVLGIKKHFFLDQTDEHFTVDENGTRRGWNSEFITHTIARLVRKEHYQYVFSVLPRSTTHGGHQAATELAAVAIQELPENIRPVLLGFDTDPARFMPMSKAEQGQTWNGTYAYAFDRTAKFGFHDALSYQIVVTWMIAEHKSQGMLQTFCGKDPKEYAWVDLASGPDPTARGEALFHELASPSESKGGGR